MWNCRIRPIVWKGILLQNLLIRYIIFWAFLFLFTDKVKERYYQRSDCAVRCSDRRSWSMMSDQGCAACTGRSAVWRIWCWRPRLGSRGCWWRRGSPPTGWGAGGWRRPQWGCGWGLGGSRCQVCRIRLLSSHLNYLYLKLERGGEGNFTSKFLTWINCNFVDKSKLAQKTSHSIENCYHNVFWRRNCSKAWCLF